MKIIFKNSELNEGIIKISLDGGFTYKDYEIADVKETGILLDDSQDYEKIKIKGPANVLKNLDVLSSINTLYESNLLPEDITGIVLKEFNGTFDKSLLQKYPNLTSVTIPNGVTTIGTDAFRDCSSLTSITLPESLTSIKEGTFGYCSSLTSIDLPEGLISIGIEAFQSCTSLTSITLPESVTDIGEWAFQGCKSLTSIKVDENNQNYSTSEDKRVLFNKDKTTLVCYPSVIGDYTIPDSVTKIDERAFYGCRSLTSITIPNSVTSIDNEAFSNCLSLTSINYTGTKEQWDEISKSTNWNVGCPSNMVINYNYQS